MNSDKTVFFGRQSRLSRRIGLIVFLLLYAVSACGIAVLRAETGDEREVKPIAANKAEFAELSTTAKPTPKPSETVEENENADTETADFPSDLQRETEDAEETPTFSGFSTVTLEKDCKTTESLPLERYVLGALLAEMPSGFCIEARKAQAVACRTYAVYKMTHEQRHESGAALCKKAAHCQAYVDPDTVSKERYESAYRAVSETEGVILCCDGEPILAAYHASSGAKTRSSAEVWGGERPYLVSVSSGECENPELAASCVRVSEISNEKFASTLRGLCASLSVYSDDMLLSNITLEKTESGRVGAVCVCGERIDSAAFVRAFSLRTTDFTISTGENVVITAYGYGHGVGLSQLGAEDMAQKGENFRTILRHYYPHTIFGQITA